MKANELMIGNWIIADNQEVQVNYITPFSIGYGKGNFAPSDTFNNTYFQPIPLTEEWLIKFGFEFKPTGEEVYEQTWKLSGFEIWQHNEGFCHDFHIGGNLHYVHQLQNLYFALTGEELKTK